MPITDPLPLRLLRKNNICSRCLHRLKSTFSARDQANPFGAYEETTPPTSAQLSYATNIFLSPHEPKNKATHLFNARKFLELPMSPFPEVAIVGRSNVGKSSLLNALMGFATEHANKTKTKGGALVSRHSGATVDLNVFGVGGVARMQDTASHNVSKKDVETRWKLVRNGSRGRQFVVLDLPGYGSGSLAAQGNEIGKYLEKREQLRRVFVIIDSRHGIKEKDKEMLSMLWTSLIPHQLVLSKVDKGVVPGEKPNWELLRDVFATQRKVAQDHYTVLKVRRHRSGTEMSLDMLATAAKKTWPRSSGQRLGIEGLRWAILQAVGLESDVQGRSRDIDLDIVAEDD